MSDPVLEGPPRVGPALAARAKSRRWEPAPRPARSWSRVTTSLFW